MVLLTPAGHLGAQFRADTFAMTSFQDAGWAGAPIWLMLARGGNTFTSYRSTDGSHWAPIGSATIVMPQTIYVGLAVSSHDNSTLNSGVFDNIDVVPTVPPPPLNQPNPPSNLTGSLFNGVDVRLQWSDNSSDETGFALERATGDADGAYDLLATLNANTTDFIDRGLAANTTYSYRVRAVRDNVTSISSAPFTITTPSAPADQLLGEDIGDVAVPGSFSTTNGVTTITAAGDDIWDQADSFFFLYRAMSGDFDVRARVTSLENTDAWAKSGMMIRASLDPQSPNVFSFLAACNVTCLQSRDTPGAFTSFTGGPWVSAPYWVRLVRSSDTFQGYISPDGVNWTLTDTRTVAMSSQVFAGIAVTSHNASTATHSTIESLTFSGN
jgi:regulation of enolase protein 1 (concanavalin A-like superfamily)